MAYRYRILDEAEEEFEHEFAYSAENWGRRHASAYRQDVMRLIRRIAQHPTLVRERPEIGKGLRTVQHKGNLIVYRVIESEKMVEIVGFPGTSRDLSVYGKRGIIQSGEPL